MCPHQYRPLHLGVEMFVEIGPLGLLDFFNQSGGPSRHGEKQTGCGRHRR